MAKGQKLEICAPKLETIGFRIRGNAPYVQNRFSHKAVEMMRAKQVAGSTAKKGKAREAKDFNACYEGSLHVSSDGWHGIPAPALRAAMVRACKLVGFAMTDAKLSLFILPDGVDKYDGTPLVRITKGEPRPVEHYVRLATGVADISCRGMWDAGWEATVRVRYDSDCFAQNDIGNLILRAGMQVGIGAGRPDSKESVGQGWGTFETDLDDAE